MRLAALLLPLAACAVPRGGDARGVEATLDQLHAAASAADEERYFACFAADGVFFGTDATERWSVAEFRAYAHPHFSRGKGWTYQPRDRHVFVQGDVAWFDERLDHASYGELRGTGVLRREAGTWKIVQYNLAFPIPNDLADEIVARIRAPAAK